MRKLLVLAALALVAGLMTLGQGQAVATHADTDLYVNDDATIGDGSSCASPDFNAIQAAINHANSGNTVLVCPGTYLEALIIDKPLTLRSTGGAAVTTVGASHYLIWIKASDVTVDGFTITNPTWETTADASAIICSLAGDISNIKILNNIIQAPASPSRSSQAFGTYGINCISGGTMQNVEVAYNIFRDINGVVIGGGYAIAIFFYGLDSSDINIHNNVIYNITSDVSPDRARAIVISWGVSDVSITCNTIYDNGVGIRMTGSAGSGVEVNYNNIYDNAHLGLWNASDEAVNAENNWWGAADGPGGDGPGTGDAVSNTGAGSVDFDPWLIAPQGEPCPPPTTKDQCKNGGWQDFNGFFKNQGDCVSFVASDGRAKGNP